MLKLGLHAPIPAPATIPIAALRQWAEEQIAMCNQMMAGAQKLFDFSMIDRWQGSALAFMILLEYLDAEEAIQHDH